MAAVGEDPPSRTMTVLFWGNYENQGRSLQIEADCSNLSANAPYYAEGPRAVRALTASRKHNEGKLKGCSPRTPTLKHPRTDKGTRRRPGPDPPMHVQGTKRSKVPSTAWRAQAHQAARLPHEPSPDAQTPANQSQGRKVQSTARPRRP